jgi:isochorismate pyruvate lyase
VFVAEENTIRKKTLPRKSVINKRGLGVERNKDLAYKNLTEVRRKIDALDAVIVPLLCERLHAVTHAAHFKPSVKGVVKKARVESIVSRVRRAAKALGSNPGAIEAVYRHMIGVCTKEEQRNWKKINK